MQGATTIEYLHTMDHNFKCAIVLDPWMYAVSPQAYVSIPLLDIQSHVYWY
jgi:hypothetical protein